MPPIKANRVTLKDVASVCGYTANTVSRALRNDEKLPENTRKLIQRRAREMGYVPNRSARALRYGSSRTIAVIVNDINNPYYANMLSQIDQLLKERNYHTMILCTQLDEQLASTMIQLAISQMVDGILFFPFNNTEHVEELQRSGIPFVLLDRWIPDVKADIARMDDYAAGYLLASHFLQLGHRRLLYLAGPYVNSSQIDRQNGILQALCDHGLDASGCLRTLPWDQIPDEPQPSEMLRLLQPLDYTGIMAYNDVLAYHCLYALQSVGIGVPKDISVAGIDHIRWRSAFLPPLTSIAVEGQSVAKTAVDMLFSRIADPALPFAQQVLPVRLHLDGTTEKPKQADTASLPE